MNPRPLLVFLADRGTAISDRALEGAIRRAEELRWEGTLDTAPHDNIRALADPDLRGAMGVFFAPQVQRRLRGLRIPVINFSNRYGPIPEIGNFLCDEEAIGRNAAEYLVRLGYQHFLVVAPQEMVYARERAAAFRRQLPPGSRVSELAADFSQRQPGQSTIQHVARVADLLRPIVADLPLDLAIFCVNDWIAGLVQYALHRHFPEREHTTAVLGVNDEPARWWYLGPSASLSSVRPAFHAMGAAAFEWLVEHAEDRDACRGLLRRFPPEGIIERASTAGGACAHPLTARLMRWAWSETRAGRRVRVADLAERHHMSRRTVERLFEAHARRSAGEYLETLRLDHARHLLRTTSLSVAEVSERCGFAKQDVLSRLFRRRLGMTPLEYRRSAASEREDAGRRISRGPG